MQRNTIVRRESDPILLLAEMQLERTPRELLDYIDSVDDRARNLPRAERHDFQVTRLGKVFNEEIRPLSVLGRICFLDQDGITLQPSLGNQPYDAILRNRSSGSVMERKIEFTKAEDGYLEHVRMEHLRMHGSAPAYGPILAEGTKNRGRQIAIAPTEFWLADDIRKQRAKELIDSGVRKFQKRYGADTWIVFVFDDYMGFHDIDDVRELANRLIEPFARLRWHCEKLVMLGIGGHAVVELAVVPPGQLRVDRCALVGREH